MKAALLTKPGVIEIKNMSKPVCGPDDLLIKIKRACICGSDNHIFLNGAIAGTNATLPFILGHECSGEVVQTGTSVKGYKIGDRVAIEPATFCGQCRYCRTGRYNLCDSYRFLAAPPDYNGVFCDLVAHNYKNCFILPENISYDQGALVEPLSIVIQAFEISQFKTGDDVLILGAGSIGLMSLMVFKALGAGRCFISDINDFKLEKAKAIGADFIINPGNNDLISFIGNKTRGRGASVVIDTAGIAVTLNQAIAASAKNATIVIIGISDEKASFDIVQVICKMLVIKGTTDFVDAFPKAISLIENGKVNVMEIVSDYYNFADIAEAFRNFNINKKTVKTMIKFD